MLITGYDGRVVRRVKRFLWLMPAFLSSEVVPGRAPKQPISARLKLNLEGRSDGRYGF